MYKFLHLLMCYKEEKIAENVGKLHVKNTLSAPICADGTKFRKNKLLA